MALVYPNSGECVVLAVFDRGVHVDRPFQHLNSLWCPPLTKVQETEAFIGTGIGTRSFSQGRSKSRLGEIVFAAQKVEHRALGEGEAILRFYPEHCVEAHLSLVEAIQGQETVSETEGRKKISGFFGRQFLKHLQSERMLVKV